jgi:hypothetical protein
MAMRNGSWGYRFVLLAALTLAGCQGAGIGGTGLDGGVGGTGISSISGNVTAADDLAETMSLAGITVSLRGTELRTETDATGLFLLEGEFDGSMTLEFEEEDGTLNQLPVDVPSGGVLSLRNVRLGGGSASAERIEVNFEGRITADASCDGTPQALTVIDNKLSNTFFVRVDGASYSFDARRCPDIDPESGEADCTDLLEQRTVRIFGVSDEAGIAARSVRLVNCRIPGSGR